MNILDIHTHHLSANLSESILSCQPPEFIPVKGAYYSLGLHPWDLSDEMLPDWNKLEELFASSQVLAIGEVGLDKVVDVDMNLQKYFFERQLAIAGKLQKPLIIHCVKAYDEIIHYKKTSNPETTWIIHGFRGKKELATQLLKHGFYLSFGEKYQTDALLATPLNRLFLETDESAVGIHALYEKAATYLSLDVRMLKSRLSQNILNVFF